MFNVYFIIYDVMFCFYQLCCDVVQAYVDQVLVLVLREIAMLSNTGDKKTSADTKNDRPWGLKETIDNQGRMRMVVAYSFEVCTCVVL